MLFFLNPTNLLKIPQKLQQSLQNYIIYKDTAEKKYWFLWEPFALVLNVWKPGTWWVYSYSLEKVSYQSGSVIKSGDWGWLSYFSSG